MSSSQMVYYVNGYNLYNFLLFSFEVASSSNNVLGGTKIIDTGAGFLLEETPEEDTSAPIKVVHEPGKDFIN